MFTDEGEIHHSSFADWKLITSFVHGFPRALRSARLSIWETGFFYPISNMIFELTLLHKPESSRKQPFYPKGVEDRSTFLGYTEFVWFGLFWTMDFLTLC